MKKIFLLLFVCAMIMSCEEPHRPTCVVIEKKRVEHKISTDDYYVITKSIYNGEKKIAKITESQFYLFAVGDTIVEPYYAHK